MIEWAPSGARRVLAHAPAGVTAVQGLGDELVLGFGDGTLERRTPGGLSVGAGLRSTPPAPVLVLGAGPSTTLVAGFASGAVGIWDLASGRLLAEDVVYGPVATVRTEAGQVRAVSELGDAVRLDLQVLERPACGILRAV